VYIIQLIGLIVNQNQGMFDRNNSFEPALLCRPQTCLSTTLQANLLQRPPDIISRFLVT